MKKNAKSEIIKINLDLFIILICLLIIPCQTIKYFKSFYLLSQEILLISDFGFLKYNQIDNSYAVKMQFNAIFSESELEFISFTQSSADEGSYVFCRIRSNIFIFDQNLNHLRSFEILEISNSFCVMKAYKTSEGKLSLIISYINEIQKLRLLMYQINLNDQNNVAVHINNITQEVMD